MDAKTTTVIIDSVVAKKITPRQARAVLSFLKEIDVVEVKGKLDASKMDDNTVYIIK